MSRADVGRPLSGRVALVAGATRGAGRGIACALGEAGATVYCTGRSVRGHPATGNRPETIEETAEMVDARGGHAIWVRVDHTDEEQVRELFERVSADSKRLDVLVNDVWGGDRLTEWGKKFWELTPARGFKMLERGVHSHVITSRYAAPLMLERDRGLLIEITDGDEKMNRDYRGNLFYDLAKISPMRLAMAMAHELRETGVVALCLTPGFLRSEAVLDHFGVTEANWADGVARDPHFSASETPEYIGRAVVALATDPRVRRFAGQALSTWGLSEEYGFTDVDGSQPHWGRYMQEHVQS